MDKGHIIKKIAVGSIAEELELESGDRVMAVNNQAIEDVFDYHYLINDEYIELTVLKKDGEEWILEIEKDAEEDLGIEFESSLMDDYHSCSNKCIFCLSTSSRMGCGKRCILRMMIPGCLFFREIILR